MAKSASTCEMRRSEMKPMDFSEPEMDVAEQLIQLSGDSGACTDDVSSTNGEIFPYNNSVEEDETFCPRKRRFRSIYHLYRSTKPVTVVNS
jgi:hypothetical protein